MNLTNVHSGPLSRYPLFWGRHLSLTPVLSIKVTTTVQGKVEITGDIYIYNVHTHVLSHSLVFDSLQLHGL